MKKFQDLPKDIYAMLKHRKGSTAFEDEKLVALGVAVAKHTADTMSEPMPRVRDKTVFYPSEIGKECVRQVWYKYNLPEVSAPISGPTHIKFLFGDYIEELLLYLAKKAGHTVEKEQERVEISVDGVTVRGRIDAVIDGVIVDVKSTTAYNFQCWNGKDLGPDNDAFGYRHQLNSYYRGAESLGLAVPNMGLFFMEKASGVIGTCNVPHDSGWEDRVRMLASVVDEPSPPPRLPSVPLKTDVHNHGLPLSCQYCDYNKTCWESRDIAKVVRGSKAIWLVSDPSREHLVLGAKDYRINDEEVSDE